MITRGHFQLINRSVAGIFAASALSVEAQHGPGNLGEGLLWFAIYVVAALTVIDVIVAFNLRGSFLARLGIAVGVPVGSVAAGIFTFYLLDQLAGPGSGQFAFLAAIAVPVLPTLGLIVVAVIQKAEEKEWRAEAARRSATPPPDGWAS